jgi:hypothetical protein
MMSIDPYNGLDTALPSAGLFFFFFFSRFSLNLASRINFVRYHTSHCRIIFVPAFHETLHQSISITVSVPYSLLPAPTAQTVGGGISPFYFFYY